MPSSLSIKPLGFVTSGAAPVTNLLGQRPIRSISQNLPNATASSRIALNLSGLGGMESPAPGMLRRETAALSGG